MRLLLKIAMVGALTIALLIPLVLIQGVVEDRQHYRSEAVASVARGHAGPQGIAGPVLVVPYTESVRVEEKDADGEVVRTVVRPGAERHWVFFPDDLVLDATLTPASRFLGLHEVRVYDLATRANARFSARIPTDADPTLPNRIGTPRLLIGLRDVRGLAGLPTLHVNGKPLSLQRGLGHGDGTGVHARLAVPRAGDTLTLDVDAQFALAGMESLAIAPLGDRNRVTLTSPWPHPLFNGDIAPRERHIGADGFTATWEVSALASNAQAQYLAGQTLPATAAGQAGGESLAVSLADPVNPYAMAERATKYGILFVALTFVGFFLFETVKQLRVHPIQYGLVGLALALFFLLLLALSERIAFGLAYLAATLACLGLLGYYVGHVLQSRWRGLGVAAALGTLYAALYGLLVSEDNAMVLGAGLLFAVLATVMVVTRRIDWYAVGAASPTTGTR
jgi:inner membrane protein